ncbi:hypothetical protein [Antrihabitans spumae]|uniref:Uncharacterized protein n=1 Tax=Antrihabitans spumae TaxID=3373370 RepID=A0ABW7KNQ4_9NOCA
MPTSTVTTTLIRAALIIVALISGLIFRRYFTDLEVAVRPRAARQDK